MRNAAVRSNLLVPEVREVMDIRQASDYLGISPDTLYKYASEGFVPAFKLGNRWRFKRSRLDEWMDRQSDMQATESRGRSAAEEAGTAGVVRAGNERARELWGSCFGCIYSRLRTPVILIRWITFAA